jgi:hypothetical protein
MIASSSHKFIVAVKTKHTLFSKKESELFILEWPSGSSVLLSCMQPDGMEPFAIRYKDGTMRMVLCFLFTKYAGSLARREPNVARSLDKLRNIKIRKVLRPAVMSELHVMWHK